MGQKQTIYILHNNREIENSNEIHQALSYSGKGSALYYKMTGTISVVSLIRTDDGL